MMNDALMQMKSRNNNTVNRLTGFVRQVLLVLTILTLSVTTTWGQITNLSSGVIDKVHISDYSTIKNTYTIDASSFIPDIKTSSSWSTYTGTQGSGQHWDGSSTYFDCWNGTRLDTEQHSKKISIMLPQGYYTLLTAARGKPGTTITMKVSDDSDHESSVSMSGRDNTGKGITTSGVASFNEGTFAKSGEGYGWQYFYIKFYVAANGTNVNINIYGHSSSEGWMSVCTPNLLTTSNNESFANAYGFELYNQGKYLNLTNGGAIISSTKQPLYIVKASGSNIYLTDGTHYLGTSDNTNLTTTTDGKKTVRVEDLSWYSPGHFTLSFTNGSTFVGADSDADNTVCRANRGQTEGSDAGTFNLWRITQSFTLTDLTQSMYNSSGCAYGFGISTQDVYGDMGVHASNYADLSGYEKLVLTVTNGAPRLLFNRQTDSGEDYIEINSVSSPYVTVSGNEWTIDIEKIVSDNGYAHLNCIKGANWANVTITAATLTGPSFTGMYHEWDGTGANANITVQHPANFVWHVDEDVAAGQVIYGESSGGVPSNQYADLSQYDNLVVTYDNTKALPRFLFNKAGDGTTITVESEGDYMTIEGNKIIIHLAKLASDNGGYAHLNCIKAPWGSGCKITSISLENVERPVTIEKTVAVGSDNMIKMDGNLLCDHIPYNYLRIELVDGDGNSVRLDPATNNQDMSQTVSTATFRVESQYGDMQNTYTRLADNIFATGSLGEWYDGIIVSSGAFTFKLPNRYDYAGNHIRIYLARYSDDAYGANNPPEIEKIYDYMLWVAGNEPTAKSQVHQLYQVNENLSSFDVDLYSLTNNGADILSHFSKTQFSEFGQFYLRWYVADKVTHQPIVDENGNPISLKTPTHVLDPKTSYNTMLYHEDVGMLWYLRNGWGDPIINTSVEMGAHAQEVLKVHVELPNGLTQNDVELVALVTDDYTNSAVNAEPSNIKHKYIVSFMAGGEIDYTNLPFRHYKGVTGRDWVTPEGSTGSMTQSIWTAATGYNYLLPTTTGNDPTAGSPSEQTVDVRQGVHTWEYNVYITPGDGQRAIVLPFENYMYGFDNSITADGNDLEPRAYFRWYDWKTDKAVVDEKSSFTFEACNPDILKSYMETVGGETRDRGLVALNLDPAHPTQGRVGVWLTVNDNFNLDNYPNGIDIACDVSKYSDGIRIFGTNAYLEHEPTLSIRYIFHVYPGKKIADELAEAKTNLGKCRTKLEDTSLTHEERLEIYSKLEYYGIPSENINPMFDLPENIGRVVVSLGAGKTGEFSLRLGEHLLENYKLYDNSNNIVTADHVKWVAFYEDEQDGNVMRKELMEGTSRIQAFTYNDFLGTYYHLGSTSAEETVIDGMRFHVIGYVTSGTGVNTLTGEGAYAPVVHYELQFLVAPPLSVNQLKNDASLRAANIMRTDEYMAQHYDLQSVVDFDGNPETNKNIVAQQWRENYFFSKLDGSGALNDAKKWFEAPSARENNMSWLPREWSDIEYSYCYPQLCNYVNDSYQGYWNYNHFLSPFHGDYMILKSMNIDGISNQRQGPPYELQWWWGTQLYDYTHTYTDTGKYGSFLYTDASNESRTMVTIPFEADLCAGSSIYVTTAVADMTNAQIKPQLLIRVVGVDDSGNHKNVVSFHTCDISTTGAQTGEWYQVYGESSIPVNFDDDIDHFICEVVNYANNTNGADFAIDQFQVYTSTAKIKFSQDQGNCDDPESNKMFIYAEAEGIQALYGRSGDAKIYWRIHDENGDPVTDEKMYSDSDDGSSIYALTTVPLDYTNHMYDNGNPVTEAMVKANDNLHWFMGDDHKVYCKIAYRYLPGLLDGHTYYVSIYSPTIESDPEIGFRPQATSYWGGLHTAATSKCSVFSSDFIPRQQFAIYYVTDASGDVEGGTILMACHAAPVVTEMKMRLKKPDVTQASGFTNIDDLHFDFFFGTMAQWASSAEFDATNHYTFAQLRSAIEDYRLPEAYPNEVGLNSSYSKVVGGVDYKDVLQAAINAKLLKLSCSQTFSNDFNEWPSPNYAVLALAVEKTVGTTAICSPFMVQFDISWPSPEMELGFADVTYPQRDGFHRIVRIGLEQLYNLRKNGYLLHIPVHDYKNKAKLENTGTLYFSEAMLKISKTSDDPLGPAMDTNFAKLVSPNSSSSHGETPFVDADHMFLALDLSGDNCQINFHEGYTYEVSTSFYDNTDPIASACTEDIYLTIKVVPEFVTWDPQPLGTQTSGGVDYYNVNWNNDANWNRSERAELYMDGADTHQQNTPTAWRQEAAVTDLDQDNPYYGNKYYKNDTEINSSLSSDKAFVPMKFTYVTLLSDKHAPSLINMDIIAYNNSEYNGGAILAGNLLTDPSPYDPSFIVNSPATPDLRYDMLVRYSEKECQGHLQSDGTPYGVGTVKVYDCEKFFGNICKEIYFKPRAELINQQRMTYEKAWVEKELEPNKWYLMSAPLKATYAGDMYVPVTMSDLSMATPATKAGRQMTEAFQPITFSTTAKAATATTTSQPAYSRTKYPFYQHSWDHGTGTNGSVVYTESNDPRQPYYDADMKYTGAITSTFAQWSHVFNDVQVAYSQMQGFAIRAHKQSGASGERALLRLPKADTDWDYYNYKDEKGTLNQGVTKGNLNYGRFVTEDSEGKPYDNKATMSVPLVQPNENTGNQYFLVGNPYMASLDMAKFFSANTHLGTEWWTINGNPTTGLNSGRVRPMEAFFVKTTSPNTPVKFANDMMVDGNDGTEQSAHSRPYMLLRASKGCFTSTALLEISDQASADNVSGEDVETLFDSNLADVPMVYTVAGSRAMSIDSRPSIDFVPFGVTCASDSEPIDVLCLMSNVQWSTLYVLDAVTGSAKEINDGGTVSVQPNDYGRYFLTTRSDLTAIREVSASDGIVVSVRNRQVTVQSASGLKSVRILTTGGAVVQSLSDCGTEATFNLSAGGVYLIETQSANGQQTTKVMTK